MLCSDVRNENNVRIDWHEQIHSYIIVWCIFDFGDEIPEKDRKKDLIVISYLYLDEEIQSNNI